MSDHDFEPAILLLNRIRTLNQEAAGSVTAFIGDPTLHSLTKRYEAGLLNRNIDLGFNLFEVISDIYYRENLHSDILKTLLDPQGKHAEKDRYLRLFFDYIALRGARLRAEDYSQPQVLRESNRIDLLVKDDVSKHAIIIENKINNAADQPRQLPRYVEHLDAYGYHCDAVVYLRLNGYCPPDTRGWTSADVARIQPLLTIVCAYDGTPGDLLTGWLRKCETSAQNIDAQHILRQYGALINKLGGNIMNKPIMEQFFTTVLEGDNFRTAQSLKAMLDDLVLFRVERIIDAFRNELHPFSAVANWHNEDAYFTGCHLGNAHLGLDVWVNEDHYAFCFWDRNDEDAEKGAAKAALEKMGCLEQFLFSEGQFKKILGFPAQEGELFQEIRSFKTKLSGIL